MGTIYYLRNAQGVYFDLGKMELLGEDPAPLVASLNAQQYRALSQHLGRVLAGSRPDETATMQQVAALLTGRLAAFAWHAEPIEGLDDSDWYPTIPPAAVQYDRYWTDAQLVAHGRWYARAGETWWADPGAAFAASGLARGRYVGGVDVEEISV